MATTEGEEGGDGDKEFEMISDHECFRHGGNTFVTNNKTHIDALYNIVRSKGVIVNTLSGQATNEKPTQSFLDVIHGRNIELSDDNTCAKMKCAAVNNGICFVKDPVTDPLHFRVTQTSQGNAGKFIIGFSRKDPSSFYNAGLLQTGMESAKHSSCITVVEPAIETSAYPGAIIYFKYENGYVHFCSSKDSARTSYPAPLCAGNDDDLWAFIELQGPVSAVELINNDFHEVCGTNVTVSGNTASRGLCASCFGSPGGFTCFTKTPIKPGAAVEFKLTNISVYMSGHMRIGICFTSPVLIPEQNIPETLTRQEDYKVVKINSEDAVYGSIISLVPIENQILVSVNNEKQVGLLEVGEASKWAVVELFGNTEAVQLLPHSQNMKIPTVSYVSGLKLSETFLKLRGEILALWLESEILMNSLKAVAEAVQGQTNTHCFSTYWNSWLGKLASLSTLAGAPEAIAQSMQQVEYGYYPEIMRTQAPRITRTVQELSCNISRVKESLNCLKEKHVPKSLKKQYELMTDVVTNLQQVEVRMPRRRTLVPDSPPPSPCLLDLSVFPVDTDREELWHDATVARALRTTANKVEAIFLPLEAKIRDIYSLGT